MKRSGWTTGCLLVGMLAFVVGLIGAAIFLYTQGGQGLPWAREAAVLRVYVQAPPLSQLGEEIKLVVTVENDSEDYRRVDEIRLPDRLMEVAVVKGIFPSLSPGTVNQMFYGDQTGFAIGLMLEPGEARNFEITLMPWQIADVPGELEVVSGEEHVRTGFRLVFDKPVALEPTLAPTEPPTATPEPIVTPSLEVIPTQTQVPVPYNAVVKLVAKEKYGVWLRPVWGGSATIVTPDGLLLTNAHLIDNDPTAFEKVLFVVSLTLDPAKPPVETYFAEPVTGMVDFEADLAILKITTDMKYNEIDPSTLNLPVVPLGDSDQINLGDTLTILGYPGIGGDTITLTSGNVGGFTAQKQYGERAFIKTAASISGGTSGGVALDNNGFMVGVPTQLGYGGQDDVVDCRIVTDTNGDGKTDYRDQCIPVGGFINALRPVNLAKPMIELAKQIAGRGGYPTQVPTPTSPYGP